MDLYRFFHPHHNPRLRQKSLRLQEISELELAAKELLRALNRASLRMSSSQTEISTQLLDSAADSVELAHEFLKNLVEIYPEDTIIDLRTLLEERKSSAGWEAWTNLLTERLKSYSDQMCYPLHCNPEEINEENPSETSIIKIKATA